MQAIGRLPWHEAVARAYCLVATTKEVRHAERARRRAASPPRRQSPAEHQQDTIDTRAVPACSGEHRQADGRRMTDGTGGVATRSTAGTALRAGPASR